MTPLSAKRIIRKRGGGSIKIRKCVDRKGRSTEVGKRIRREIGTKWRRAVRKRRAEE
jgi:hypothetical protein